MSDDTPGWASTLASGGPEAMAAAFLTGAKNRHVRRAGLAAVYAAAGYRTWLRAKAQVGQRRNFHIAVEDRDAVYRDLHKWILDQLPAESRRSLVVHTTGQHPELVEDFEGGPVSPRNLELVYDGSRTVDLNVNGHRVTCHIEQLGGQSGADRNYGKPDRLIFTAPTADARDAILAVIAGLCRHETRVPRLYMEQWGRWHARADLPLRPLDTVILPGGHRERIVEDLGRFLAAEGRYVRIGAPWHRGYLFYGPPGTGKSSAARAIASHFGLDVFFASLADSTKDAQVIEQIGNLPPRALLLLEDIDTVFSATNREDESGKSTAAALLNALDGVTTPHGMIVVMTTNHVDRLDPALIRPGRVDQRFEFSPLDGDQLERLAALIVGRNIDLDGRQPTPGMTAATLIEAIKAHLDDDQDGLTKAVLTAIDEAWVTFDIEYPVEAF